MQQHELRQPAGATHRRKRVGRGNASGHGTYSGKGLKGQKARAGGGVRPGFEGGQLPLIRRMARKRGFQNPFRVAYEEVNVEQLARFPAGTDVTAQTLLDARIIRHIRKPLKILGDGELSVPLTVEAASFSKSARSKIEAAGGSVRWSNGAPQPAGPEAAATEQDAPKPKRARARKTASETDAQGRAKRGRPEQEKAEDGADS